ncbi:2-amino-4-hydroxy-6-hydroxymethyldihydropteridine diphosphokinase [Deinococcus deserti]|uniref:2-amino-4-hydroxy-6- hydroxymethyldihydropteridine diphosphokinase n=1 Tax=Deinococcus deserti TaxID=310783 RepID=UPI00308442C8
MGANLGDAHGTLCWAREAVTSLGDVHASSRLYRTAPVGGPPGQPDYLNAALHLRTSLDPHALLQALHRLEDQAGRERRERWEARVLDLDLLLYGDQVHAGPLLTLPHPRAWERGFVLCPLNDLNPALAHPLTGETVAQALKRVELTGVSVAGLEWSPFRGHR